MAWDRKKLPSTSRGERVDFRTSSAISRRCSARGSSERSAFAMRRNALDGVGRCGRQYGSASWLPELRPVSLASPGSASLADPSQISGACGRLMCCLRYEHEFYVQSRKRFPKKGGSCDDDRRGKVLANQHLQYRVTLRGPEATPARPARRPSAELDRVAVGRRTSMPTATPSPARMTHRVPTAPRRWMRLSQPPSRAADRASAGGRHRAGCYPSTPQCPRGRGHSVDRDGCDAGANRGYGGPARPPTPGRRGGAAESGRLSGFNIDGE